MIAKRYPPPATRSGLTRRVTINQFRMYVNVNFYENLQPCEVFVTTAKQGSTIAGFVDGICIAISYGLQYGIPWSVFRKKLSHMTFEPRDEENASAIDLLAKTVTDLISIYGGKEDEGPILNQKENETNDSKPECG